MKKINKLLMPLVGLTTMFSIAAPLTSCSSSRDVKVNAQEWQNAIDYLCLKKDGAQWKSTKDDQIDIYMKQEHKESGKTTSETVFSGFGNMFITQDAQTSDFVNDIETVGQPINESQTEIFNKSIIRRNNFYLNYDWYNDESGNFKLKNGDISTDSEILETLKTIFDSYVDFESFKYDNSKHAYVYVGQYEQEGNLITLNTKMSFNSNKLISSMETDLIIKFVIPGNDEEITTTNLAVKVLLHPQYGNIVVDIEPKIIDRANDHIFEMKSQVLPYIIDGRDNPREGMIVNINPYSTLDKAVIAFKNWDDVPQDISVIGIYKNNKLLEMGSEGEPHDYWVGEEEESPGLPNLIHLTEPVNETDKLSVAVQFGGVHIHGADDRGWIELRNTNRIC